MSVIIPHYTGKLWRSQLNQGVWWIFPTDSLDNHFTVCLCFLFHISLFKTCLIFWMFVFLENDLHLMLTAGNTGSFMKWIENFKTPSTQKMSFSSCSFICFSVLTLNLSLTRVPTSMICDITTSLEPIMVQFAT